MKSAAALVTLTWRALASPGPSSSSSRHAGISVGLVGREQEISDRRSLSFAQTALPATLVSPASFTFAFPAGDEVSFGEKVFSHFALKVTHLLWTSSFERQSWYPLTQRPVQRTGHGLYSQADLDLKLNSVAFQGYWLQVQFFLC